MKKHLYFIAGIMLSMSWTNAIAIPLIPNTGFTIFPSSPSLGGNWFTTFQFTLATPGILTIVDMCHGGDAYEIFNFGSSLGTTSTAGSFTSTCLLTPTAAETIAIPDTRWDEAVFNLSAGTYDISGVTTIDGGPGANRAAIKLEALQVPEPTTLTLMGLGLAGIGYRRRNRIRIAA